MIRRPLDILAVAGLAIAVANGVAFGLVLRARWFWSFFDTWEAPVYFLCSGLALGGACWWVSTNVEGLYKGAANSGVVVSAVTSIIVVILAAIALLLLAARFIFENIEGILGKSQRRSSGRRGKRRRR